MRLARAVPVLQVSDVARSVEWYVALFGFDPDPFPKSPPYGFAMLRRDDAEIMLQAGESSRPAGVEEEGWTVVPADADVPAAREREESAP